MSRHNTVFYGGGVDHAAVFVLPGDGVAVLLCGVGCRVGSITSHSHDLGSPACEGIGVLSVCCLGGSCVSGNSAVFHAGGIDHAAIFVLPGDCCNYALDLEVLVDRTCVDAFTSDGDGSRADLCVVAISHSIVGAFGQSGALVCDGDNRRNGLAGIVVFRFDTADDGIRSNGNRHDGEGFCLFISVVAHAFDGDLTEAHLNVIVEVIAIGNRIVDAFDQSGAFVCDGDNRLDGLTGIGIRIFNTADRCIVDRDGGNRSCELVAFHICIAVIALDHPIDRMGAYSNCGGDVFTPVFLVVCAVQNGTVLHNTGLDNGLGLAGIGEAECLGLGGDGGPLDLFFCLGQLDNGIPFVTCHCLNRNQNVAAVFYTVAFGQSQLAGAIAPKVTEGDTGGIAGQFQIFAVPVNNIAGSDGRINDGHRRAIDGDTRSINDAAGNDGCTVESDVQI